MRIVSHPKEAGFALVSHLERYGLTRLRSKAKGRAAGLGVDPEADKGAWKGQAGWFRGLGPRSGPAQRLVQWLVQCWVPGSKGPSIGAKPACKKCAKNVQTYYKLDFFVFAPTGPTDARIAPTTAGPYRGANPSVVPELPAPVAPPLIDLAWPGLALPIWRWR